MNTPTRIYLILRDGFDAEAFATPSGAVDRLWELRDVEGVPLDPGDAPRIMRWAASTIPAVSLSEGVALETVEVQP